MVMDLMVSGPPDANKLDPAVPQPKLHHQPSLSARPMTNTGRPRAEKQAFRLLWPPRVKGISFIV